jgi:hypothetical protein
MTLNCVLKMHTFDIYLSNRCSLSLLTFAFDAIAGSTAGARLTDELHSDSIPTPAPRTPHPLLKPSCSITVRDTTTREGYRKAPMLLRQVKSSPTEHSTAQHSTV